MFSRQQYIFIGSIIFILLLSAFFTTQVYAQKNTDTTKLLKTVTVAAGKTPANYRAPVPVQALNYEALQEINGESIGDAAKYFSGILIKDYGGVGGLKTISVRGLGALNTGLVYDGIYTADAQTGQIDLSKFSSTFIQSMELADANPQQLLQPARTYASASILSVTTNTFNVTNFTQKKWVAGVNQGSFGLWRPFAGIYIPAAKSIVISANAAATWDKGDYPYTVENGPFSQKTTRTNSDIKSFQGEINLVKQFKDSSQLQTKFWSYISQRGLPGSIIYFNNTAAQRLWDNDYFVQTRYQKKINTNTSLLLSAKYNSAYTRYKDPNFLNNAGGLDDRYYQHELYLSAALSRQIGKYFSCSVASDFALTNLTSNIASFVTPTRNNWWNSVALQYAKRHWQVNASLLNTMVIDKTKIGNPDTDKNEWTPTVALSYKLNAESPFLFRFFYKDIFRMPTFNDLYYTYISSINPKVLPEYSKQYNLGITYTKNFNAAVKQFSISADGYYNSIKDKIISTPSQNLFIWTTTNRGKVAVKGIDINSEANGKFSSAVKWSARIAYTWQQALDITNPSDAEYKNQIPYTPENSGSALAIIYYKSWSAGYGFLFSGSRYALAANDPSNQLPAWDTHDLFLVKAIKFQHFQAMLRAEVKNIFNNRYDVVQYYPMPGRSYKISITINNL